MKTLLSSSVPTHYQSQSIRAFGLGVKSNMDGSLSCGRMFHTKKEAAEYMLNLAVDLAKNDRDLRQMRFDIKKYGKLYYDAACLSIS